MAIKEECIFIAKCFININQQVLMLEDKDIKEYLKNAEKNFEDNMEIVSNIIIAYKNVRKIPNKTNCNDIINFIHNSTLDYEINQYISYILVSEYGVSPFELFNNIDSRDLFCDIHSYIEDTFAICSETAIDVILECIHKVYEFTKTDIAQGRIFCKINKYFEHFFDTNELLVSSFFQQPDDSLQICIMMAIDNIIKIDENKAENLLNLLLKSEVPLHRSTACACYINIVETHWHIVCKKIDEIFSLCEKLPDDFFIGNSMRLFIAVLAKQRNQDSQQKIKLEKIVKDYSEESNYIKFLILKELNIRFKDINEFAYEIYKRLFSTRLGENLGLIQELDDTAYQLLEMSKLSETFNLLKTFYVTNQNNFKAKTFSDCFDSTLAEFTSKLINQIIPNIYKDITSRNVVLVNFAMEFVQQVAFFTDFKRINLTVTVTESNILIIIKIITNQCFKAEFVCYLGIKLLDIELSKEAFIEYKNFYINKISGNYPNTSKKIAESFEHANQQQELLIDAAIAYVQERENNYRRTREIKDFQPSVKRVLQYSIAQAKLNKKAIDLVKEKSVLMKLVTTQHIKYGKRCSTNIQLENNESRLSENEFSSFEYSQEMPIKYISDPLGHLYDRLEVINQGGDEYEIDY